jgi:hypothetical protein
VFWIVEQKVASSDQKVANLKQKSSWFAEKIAKSSWFGAKVANLEQKICSTK